MKKLPIYLRARMALTVGALLGLAGGALAQETDDAIVIGQKRQIESKVLNETRALWISTPSSYDAGEESYPVLYVLDGDAHFHHTTGTVGFLASNDRIPEMLVVAIPNTDRTRDLTPPSQLEEDLETSPTHGGADNFLRFLSDELIPFIDESYRTRPYRILVGHSFGGLFAMHTLTSRPEVFNAYIAISPSLQWSDQGLVGQAETFFESTPELEADLYMTVGNEGGALLGGVRKVSGILDESTPKGFRWGFKLMEEETHGSVPHRSTYQGLEAIFHGWMLPDALALFDDGGLEAIDKYYLIGGRRFGYERETPANTLFMLGFRLIDAERLDEAATVLFRDPDSPPPSMIVDRLAAGYAEKNDEENAREYYTRSLKANPGNENAKKKLTELGVDVAALIPEVAVAPDVLATYVGKYEFTPALILSITVEGSKLMGQATGQPKYELIAISETRFAAIGIDAQLEFHADDEGSVDRLTLILPGQEVLPAGRIE